MKLYDNKMANSPRKVRMFLAEKNITDIEIIDIDLMKGEHKTPEYRAIAPNSRIPALQLDDGTVIMESTAICRYLEESNQGKINLFGSTPKDRALIEMWNRRLEIDGYIPLMAGIRNKFERFDGKVLAGTRNDLKRSDIIVKRGEDSARILFERLDKYLDKYFFVAGKEFSVADITLFSTLELANNIGLNLDEYVNILDLKTRLSERDAFKK